MSKSVVKQECVRARVWGVRKAPGLVTTSLTTPVRVRTFLALCCSGTAGKGAKMVRSELQDSLHRLANHVECQLADLIRELLSEGRCGAVTTIAWSGCQFIESLREIRDGRDGGDA